MAPFWCYPAKMAKQDTWPRITLRLPPDLHQKLTEAAGANSLNAEIVARLDESFSEESRAASELLAAEVAKHVLIALDDMKAINIARPQENIDNLRGNPSPKPTDADKD